MFRTLLRQVRQYRAAALLTPFFAWESLRLTTFRIDFGRIREALAFSIPMVPLLLSGFLFPLNSMPLFFQWLANIFPAKWFILAIKDVMIKGSGFFDIWKYLGILMLMAAILITISLTNVDKSK